MKHAFRGKHGHVFVLEKGRKASDLDFTRECISAKEASRTDLMSEKLEAAWRVSRRYHTCWQCLEPTEEVGGYDVKGDKILFYECERCDPPAERKK